MRKLSASGGFFICYIFNLFRHSGWGALALILWLLRLWLGVIPLFIPLALLGVWLLAALLVTLFFSWASRVGSEPSQLRKNINPYSAKNEDFLPPQKEDVERYRT